MNRKDINLLRQGLSELKNSLNNEIEAAGQLLQHIQADPSQKRKPRSAQSDPYLAARNEKGSFALNFSDMFNSPERFRQHYRMSPDTFSYIYEAIKQNIEKEGPRAISAKERLSVTLRYQLNMLF